MRGYLFYGLVMELADVPDSKSGGAIRVGSSPTLATICPISPTAEATGLEPVKCGFESHVGYHGAGKLRCKYHVLRQQ